MRPKLYMRKERDAIDLFAAFMNVNSMEATESNFDKLRKEVQRAEKRIMKEVRMKRMKGVSVGRHPFFQQRGSFDGEKMVVALRIAFNRDGMEYYDDVAQFVHGLGFEEKAMALAARTTNHRGRIEELDYDRTVTHLSVADIVKGVVEDMEEVAKNRKLMAKKKPLNRDRRLKQIEKKVKEPIKKRGEMPPPTKKFKDKTKYDRKQQKRYEGTDMDSTKIAKELVKIARELAGKGIVATVRKGDVYTDVGYRGPIHEYSSSGHYAYAEVLGEKGGNYILHIKGWKTDKKVEMPVAEFEELIRNKKIEKSNAEDWTENWTDKDWDIFIKKNIATLAAPVIKNIRQKIAKELKEEKKKVREGVVVNGRLKSRYSEFYIYVYLGNVYFGKGKGIPMGVESSDVLKHPTFVKLLSKSLKPVEFTLPMMIGGEKFEAKYRAEILLGDSATSLQLKAVLVNADELTKAAPDQETIDQLFESLADDMLMYIDEAIETDVVDWTPDVEFEYHVEPAQRGGWTDPSWDAYVDEMYFEPDTFERTMDWSFVIENTKIADEMKSLEKLGVKVDLTSIARKILKGFGSLRIEDIDTDTLAGSTNATATIKKVDNAGVHYQIVLDEPDDSAATAIMEQGPDDPY